MEKILLIGGSGFVGQHMRALYEGKAHVFSTGRDFDVREAEKILTLIQDFNPDKVVNLAAISTLKESFLSPKDTYDTNFMGTFNILMGLRKCNFMGRLLFISSSEVYGSILASELPVSESKPTKPMSPYAVSKIAAEMLCYQWSQAENFEIVIARPFNHIGPGQSSRFAISNFGRQIASIKLGLSDPVLEVGDIDTTRDFTDVRDVVSAYKLLLETGKNGDTYNICSGNERSIRSILKNMCDLIDIDIEIHEDLNKFRISEQRRIVGDSSKLRGDLGWAPAYKIDSTLKQILDHWVTVLSPFDK
jgi:GDP-4-dehydro-6-deoxy-D-mannose reductase